MEKRKNNCLELYTKDKDVKDRISVLWYTLCKEDLDSNECEQIWRVKDLFKQELSSVEQ